MIETRNPYKPFFREKKALLEAALHLMQEGKFQSPLSEIAFHAKLTVSTAQQFYHDRTGLIEELKAHVLAELHKLMDASISVQGNEASRFKSYWFACYNFYLRNPGVVKFIDQLPSLTRKREEVISFHTSLNKPLDVFLQAINVTSTANTTMIVNSTIAALAKNVLDQRISVGNEELTRLSTALWTTMIARKHA